jgi:DNA-binding YbaB/EbfC family protein
MAGVGKMLKQAQKMQQQIEMIQRGLADKEIMVSSGGGAIEIKVNGQGEFLGLTLDPEFLKEEKEFVEETLLAAIKEAAAKAKAAGDAEMQKATAGFTMPGLF